MRTRIWRLALAPLVFSACAQAEMFLQQMGLQETPVEAQTTIAKPQKPSWHPPDYGKSFGAHWYDGKAELTSYRLTYPRYGELRKGKAVMITVTERMNPESRVKTDKANAGVGVLKLNLVEDFQTGIYDYNMMTSVFVALGRETPLGPGAPLKVSFSSQEWCGHVYSQALFDPGQVRLMQHSYFEGEADQAETLSMPPNAFSEDALYLWSRGLAGPNVRPGEQGTLPLLTSLTHSRLNHVPQKFVQATLRVDTKVETIEVLGKKEEVRKHTAVVHDGEKKRVYDFWVETTPPHYLLRYRRNDGLSGEFLATTRTQYWNQKKNKDISELQKLGLQR